MSDELPDAARPPRASGPSPSQRRALTLLKAGALGGHAGALAVTAFFFATRGVASGVWCLVSAGVALVFYLLGQAVQVRVADEDPERVLVVSLVSYGVRVSALGGLLALALTQGARLESLDRVAVVAGTLTVVVSWLAAEIVAFSRMRFPLYEQQSPKRGTSTAG